MVTPPAAPNPPASLMADKCDEATSLIEELILAQFPGFLGNRGKIGGYTCTSTEAELKVCFNLWSSAVAENSVKPIVEDDSFGQSVVAVVFSSCNAGYMVDFTCTDDYETTYSCAIVTPFPYCICDKKTQNPFVLSSQYTVVPVNRQEDRLCWTISYDAAVAAQPGKCRAKYGKAKKLELSLDYGAKKNVLGAVNAKGKSLSAMWAKDTTNTVWVDSYKITNLNLDQAKVDAGFSICLRVTKGTRYSDLAAVIENPDGSSYKEDLGFYSFFDYTQKCCGVRYYYP